MSDILNLARSPIFYFSIKVESQRNSMLYVIPAKPDERQTRYGPKAYGTPIEQQRPPQGSQETSTRALNW